MTDMMRKMAADWLAATSNEKQASKAPDKKLPGRPSDLSFARKLAEAVYVRTIVVRPAHTSKRKSRPSPAVRRLLIEGKSFRNGGFFAVERSRAPVAMAQIYREVAELYGCTEAWVRRSYAAHRAEVQLSFQSELAKRRAKADQLQSRKRQEAVLQWIAANGVRTEKDRDNK